ncbi:MAG: TetR/AcrR family transcriptional regulator [Lachnospiraceae bacterium]|nr:TetR/AcrR family transcriptional regulator [Lachnospiraceae bacterium]
MDRRIEKTKKSIREAYFELLMKNSSHKITIAEIARMANIDRKTFYLHYDTVDDIVQDFAQDKINEVVFYLKKSYTADRPIDVHILFEILNKVLEENMDIFRTIALNQKYDHFFDRLKELFVTILINDYQSYFGFSEVEFRIFADYFVSGILSVYMLWIRESLPVSLDRLTDMLNTAAYGGLRNLLPEQLR